jgi:membrane peptidoglycan carboxypeptidase
VDPSDNTLAGWRPRLGVEGAGRVRSRLASSADDFALYTLKLTGLERGKQLYESATGATISGATGQLGIGFGPGTEVSPLRLASAYAMFATNGVRTEPNPVSRVYVDGVEVAPVQPGGTRLISDGAAYITTQLLRSTLGFGPDGNRGTAREAFRRSGLRHSSVEMGAKTGSGPHSVWMVSVSPRLVVTVLLTYQCHSNIRNASEMFASDTAAVLWADFMACVARLRPDLLSGSFPRPASVTEVPIDLRTGCSSARAGDFREYFIAGTEPGPCPP